MQKKQLSELLEQLKKDPQKIDLFSKAVRQKMGEDWQGMIALIDEAIASTKEVSMEAYGKALLLKIEYSMTAGQLDTAIRFGEEANLLFEKENEAEKAAQVCRLLLISYREQGHYGKALDMARKAVEKWRIHQNSEIYLECLLELVQLYVDMRAIPYAKKVLNLVDSMKSHMTEALKYKKALESFYIALEQNQEADAIEECKKAYSLIEPYDKKSYPEKWGEFLILRAQLNAKRKLKLQAEKDFKEAGKLTQNMDLLKIKLQLAWSRYELEVQEESAQVLEKLEQTIKLAGVIGAVPLVVKGLALEAKYYEALENWAQAYKALKRSKKEEAKGLENPVGLWIETLESGEAKEEMKASENLDQQMKYMANVGQALSADLSLENMQQVIQNEVAKLMKVDIVGIAMMKKEELSYKVLDLANGWLPGEDDLVRYTLRIADFCTQYQVNLVINDGNFEEYSLKNIVGSQNGMQLQSAIVRTLKVENQVVGALVIGSYEIGAYSEQAIYKAEVLATYLGMALKNSSLYHQIHYLSDHDHLTGLLSQPVALKKGETLFKENHKKHKKTAVVMLDTDWFKQVNNKYGHQLGDEVLRKLGSIIKQNVDEGDYAGRYGGEQFIAILNNKNSQEVNLVAKRIKETLEAENFETKKEKNIKVTISGGIYICNEYTLNFADALRFADHALYRAKLLGRNRIISYSLND